MSARELHDECVHCGFCLSACPTYLATGDETRSPRGRIYLMKGLAEGTSRLDRPVVDSFDSCLGCMGCVTACPSGVQYDLLIEQTRARIEADHPRSLSDRLFRFFLFSLFPHPRRLAVMRLLLFVYAATGLQWLVRKLGLLRLLPRRVQQLDALMPAIDRAAPSAALPAVTPATPPVRKRVALVAGCVQRVFFPNVNRATVRVLAVEGCEVRVPPGQGCCGALSLHAGREAEAKRLARALIARFAAEPVDAIVVNAAGCGSTLKHYDRLFADEPEWAPRAAAFSAKVRDVSELLVELGPRAPRHPIRARIAYHDACHLLHAQRIRQPPRTLLNGIPELELCEIADGDQCCGSAGVYNLLEPTLAREIGGRKVDHVLATGATLLVSANPGCTLQIQSLLGERGQQLPAAHPIELLDASLAGRRLVTGE